MSRATDKAQARLAAATQTVTEWEARAADLRGKLGDAERGLGQATLETGDPVIAARGVSDLRDQVEAAEQAVVAAQAACVPLKREALSAEAADHRAEHERLGKQADRHAAKTRELVAALEAHEGGTWKTVLHNSTYGGHQVLDEGLQTQALRQEADQALWRAMDFERQAEAVAPRPL